MSEWLTEETMSGRLIDEFRVQVPNLFIHEKVGEERPAASFGGRLSRGFPGWLSSPRRGCHTVHTPKAVGLQRRVVGGTSFLRDRPLRSAPDIQPLGA